MLNQTYGKDVVSNALEGFMIAGIRRRSTSALGPGARQSR